MESARFNRILSTIALLSFAACGAPSQPIFAGNASPSLLIRPDHNRHCKGDNGVRAVPCPVVLTDARGTAVKVSGPGVLYSFWNGVGCDNDTICSAVEDSSDLLEWHVKPGPDCGEWYGSGISGENSSLQVVGYYNLLVINHHCKKH
jgi:hypothetical protein